MDYLYKQMRGKLSSVGDEKEDEDRSTRDKRMQPQKTQSFKGEKKRTPSWLQRQFSRQMSRDYSRNSDDYQAAVAAAAFAIKSLEESRSEDRKRPSRGQDTSLTKVQSKPDGTAREPEAWTRAGKFPEQDLRSKSDISDTRVPIRTQTMEDMPEKAVRPALSVKKTPTVADHLNNRVDAENGAPGKAIGPASSMKRTSTFGDKSFDRRPGTGLPKPDLPPSKQAATRKQSSIQQGSYSTEADEWQKAEMAKLKEKYEKLDATILNWENKKKTKAKRRLDKIEAELDKRRAKAMQDYREKIARIDNIAGGAKAQAEENRRNEELKVKEKANKMRLTGKLPGSCLCF